MFLLAHYTQGAAMTNKKSMPIVNEVIMVFIFTSFRDLNIIVQPNYSLIQLTIALKIILSRLNGNKTSNLFFFPIHFKIFFEIMKISTTNVIQLSFTG